LLADWGPGARLPRGLVKEGGCSPKLAYTHPPKAESTAEVTNSTRQALVGGCLQQYKPKKKRQTRVPTKKKRQKTKRSSKIIPGHVIIELKVWQVIKKKKRKKPEEPVKKRAKKWERIVEG